MELRDGLRRRAAQSATQAEPGAQGSYAPEAARRLRRVRAKARLDGELRSIAVDLLGPNESDEFPSGCADWVATTTDRAIATIGDDALDALVRRLDLLLVGAPPQVARHLDQARARRDAGFD
jgi:hypothetical protein